MSAANIQKSNLIQSARELQQESCYSIKIPVKSYMFGLIGPHQHVFIKYCFYEDCYV